MSVSSISGTRPERDFNWLSEYLQNARSFHADFVRQVDRVQQIVRKAKDVIDFFVPTFKHFGFAREDEWRMIFVPSPTSEVKPRYRPTRDMLVPYFSLKDLVLSLNIVSKETWRLPIHQVCIGPNRHRELNRACAQSLLSDNGYTCPVVASETPYRS